MCTTTGVFEILAGGELGAAADLETAMGLNSLCV